MMETNQVSLPPEEREFLQKQAEAAARRQANVSVETNTPNSTHHGIIEEFDRGGVVIRELGTNKRISLRWSKVDTLSELSQSTDAGRGQYQQERSYAAGGGR